MPICFAAFRNTSLHTGVIRILGVLPRYRAHRPTLGGGSSGVEAPAVLRAAVDGPSPSSPHHPKFNVPPRISLTPPPPAEPGTTLPSLRVLRTVKLGKHVELLRRWDAVRQEVKPLGALVLASADPDRSTGLPSGPPVLRHRGGGGCRYLLGWTAY